MPKRLCLNEVKNDPFLADHGNNSAYHMACASCGKVVTSLFSINEINLRWARLVLGWVTVSGFDSQRWHFISVRNQPPRSTHLLPCVGQQKMSTSQMVVMLCGWRVKAGMV